MREQSQALKYVEFNGCTQILTMNRKAVEGQIADVGRGSDGRSKALGLAAI